MITMRRFLLFSCLALLTGCTTTTPTPCPKPSHPASTGDNCLYKMMVTEITPGSPWVKGKFPEDQIVNRKADPTKEFSFLVRELDWLVSKGLLLKGHTYYFNNGHGSPFLEAFPEGYEPDGY
jgi:hypothetical protein